MQDSSLITLTLNKKIGNGESIRFWLDRWLGEISLSCLFPQLFQ